jgi:hypothetical protein
MHVTSLKVGSRLPNCIFNIAMGSYSGRSIGTCPWAHNIQCINEKIGCCSNACMPHKALELHVLRVAAKTVQVKAAHLQEHMHATVHSTHTSDANSLSVCT